MTARAKQVAFVIGEEEKAMLSELAIDEARSVANYLRTLIRREHGALLERRRQARAAKRAAKTATA